MPRALLALFVLLALSGAARAQKTGKKSAKHKPSFAAPSKVDQQAFDQIFESFAQEDGHAYLDRADPPDPVVLNDILKDLKEPGLTRSQRRIARLAEIVDGVECIQTGQQGLPEDVYAAMVGQVADDLEVGVLVEADLDLQSPQNTRAHRVLNAKEKSLILACVKESQPAKKDRRAAYRRCLGRHKAADAYPASSTLPVDLDGIKGSAGCTKLAEEVEAARQKLPAGYAAGFEKNLNAARDRFMAGVATMDLGGAGSPAVAPAKSLGIASTPATYTISKDPKKLAQGLAPPLGDADLVTGAQLAQTAMNHQVGVTHRCYQWVTEALQALGIVSREDIAKTGLRGHAYQFAEFIDKHPGLVNRRFRKVHNPHWPQRIGAIVVWDQGACNYSAVSGHIEIISRITPKPEACSDFCGAFQYVCLDELSDKPAKAAALKPAAEQAVSDAQAAYDQTKKRKELRALRAKKAALAAVEADLEPHVTVYVIEHENAVVASKQ